VQTRIFEPETEVLGGWRKLHTEELYNLYFSSNIIMVIKWREMEWKDIQHTWERGKY